MLWVRVNFKSMFNEFESHGDVSLGLTFLCGKESGGIFRNEILDCHSNLRNILEAIATIRIFLITTNKEKKLWEQLPHSLGDLSIGSMIQNHCNTVEGILNWVQAIGCQRIHQHRDGNFLNLLNELSVLGNWINNSANGNNAALSSKRRLTIIVLGISLDESLIRTDQMLCQLKGKRTNIFIIERHDLLKGVD